MLTLPDGFLPAASLYQGKLSFRGVENNARLSFFADLVIAGIQFTFQLFYQRLTEADRTILTRIALLQIWQFGRGAGGGFQRRKWHRSNFASDVFSLFLFSQAPLNDFLRMFCTCISFNTWTPALLKDLTRLFLVTEAGLIIFPPRLCFIRDRTHRTAREDRVHHWASSALIQRWSETRASDQTQQRCGHPWLHPWAILQYTQCKTLNLIRWCALASFCFFCKQRLDFADTLLINMHQMRFTESCDF